MRVVAGQTILEQRAWRPTPVLRRRGDCTPLSIECILEHDDSDELLEDLAHRLQAHLDHVQVHTNLKNTLRIEHQGLEFNCNLAAIAHHTIEDLLKAAEALLGFEEAARTVFLHKLYERLHALEEEGQIPRPHGLNWETGVILNKTKCFKEWTCHVFWARQVDVFDVEHMDIAVWVGLPEKRWI